MPEKDDQPSAEMIKSMKECISSQRVTIAEREDEIRRLKKAFRLAELKGTFPADYEYYFDDDDDDDGDEVKDEEEEELEDFDGTENISSASTSDGASDEAPMAIFDLEDDVYRCTLCAFEVVEGFCQSCATMHQYGQETTFQEDMERVYSNVSTEHTYVHSDRHIVPRGTTPLLPVTENGKFALPGYSVEEYVALRRRGATRAMIQQFDMGFDEMEGITAWADSTIFEEFSGPAMSNGDKWKIHLGRRLQLEPDDLDGSLFIEDLLEEITCAPPLWWETFSTKESGETVWITKPSPNVNVNFAVFDGGDEQHDFEGASRYSHEPDDFQVADEAGISVGKLLRLREAEVADAPLRLPTEYIEDEEEEYTEEGAFMDTIDAGFESDTNWSARDPSDEEAGVANESTVAEGSQINIEVGRAGDVDIEMENASETDSTDDIPGSDWDSDDPDE